jgi:hypothetical protein
MTEENENSNILIKLLEMIKIKIPNLKKIYLGGNHFSRIKDFRIVVKKALPNLEYLDGSKI